MPLSPAAAVDAPAARPAVRVTIAYLALTLPLALAGVGDPVASVAVASMHVAMLLAGIVAIRVRGAVADWLPLLLVPLLYAELPTLIRGAGAAFHDDAVQRWEHAMFGASPATTLAPAFPQQVLSELLHACYLAYYAIIYVPPLLLFLAGRRREFDETVFAIVLTFVVCFAVFTVFPVQGPRYLWAPAVPDGPVRRIVQWLLEEGSSRGAAFPSSHVAVAVVQAGMAIMARRASGWLLWGLALGLAVGAVYGGFHYAVDALAGAGLGLVVVAAAPALHRRVLSLDVRERTVA